MYTPPPVIYVPPESGPAMTKVDMAKKAALVGANKFMAKCLHHGMTAHYTDSRFCCVCKSINRRKKKKQYEY